MYFGLVISAERLRSGRTRGVGVLSVLATWHGRAVGGDGRAVPGVLHTRHTPPHRLKLPLRATSVRERAGRGLSLGGSRGGGGGLHVGCGWGLSCRWATVCRSPPQPLARAPWPTWRLAWWRWELPVGCALGPGGGQRDVRAGKTAAWRVHARGAVQ
jgi:hypothetical protein